MTHYQDNMTECFVRHCTRDTNFLKINYIAINISTFYSPV